MSNVIPDMVSPEEFPYCIWHPDVATEETYRQLQTRYPQLRYHVGRACAVAGYAALYEELDLLPEVSIAEEARENGSKYIFDSIVSAPSRYAIMNDYSRTVDETQLRQTFLNGDTCVRSMLDLKRTLSGRLILGPGHRQFDITEDFLIDDCDQDSPSPRPREAVLLLYSGVGKPFYA
ncbi:hypothetical protein K402DRAFT_413180 [Aulographum hederae CBS 113979]|uniref:Uncharacterized protein n=1 Tax=Aulographum hederae CBS 113979 TaxID=1176131 RepID=A0A6G1GXS7_9PEZI|nr:hypothetical protein K402DRAFT_413180 [Aulographum hederae CBS 113979]